MIAWAPLLVVAAAFVLAQLIIQRGVRGIALGQVVQTTDASQPTTPGTFRWVDIGRIDILPRMSVVEVPANEVERLCDALGRVMLSGRKLLPRPAEHWRFKMSTQ